MKRLVLILSLLVLAGTASSTGVRSTAASGTDGAVIFASGRDGDADLYAVNTDGTGLTRLTNTPDDESDPLPSPDGRHVLFEGDGLQVMEADGTGRRSLPYCERSSEAWSPDSRHLVCSGYEQGVVILDTVDGTSTQLTDAGSRPSWSPDGSTIAFIDGYKLYVMGAMLGKVVSVALILGLVIGVVPGVYLLLRHGRAARKMGIPFAPFLALGSVIALFAGEWLLDAYLGLLSS